MKVEQISTGRYATDFYDCNNRRCRPVIRAADKKEAIRTVKRLAKAGLDAVPQTVGGMSLGEALRKADREHYSNAKNRRKTSTIIKQLEEAFGIDKPIKQIDYDTINTVIQIWKNSGSANATINRRLSLLGKVLNLATLWKYNGKPALLVKPKVPKLKESKGRTRIISPEEELKCINILIGKHQDLFCVLIDTGMRLGEALGMQNSPIDFNLIERRKLSGLYSYSEINLQTRKIHVWANKGDLPRAIPMTNRAYSILSKYRGEQQPFDMTADMVTAQWRKLRRLMELEQDKGFTPHACRHTCATRLLELTGDIYMVKEWLGHANVTTTERYTHATNSRLESAVSLIDKAAENLPDMDSSVA